MRRAIALAAALFGAAGSLSAQETVLDLGQMQRLAAETYSAGRWAESRQAAEALLQRDPGDTTARTILARSAYELGDMSAAGAAAAALWRSDLPDERRYEAARLAAIAAANEGRILAAQWWLRRALTVAPSEADRVQTNRDATGLRRLTPWRTDVDLSFAPSDNVNGGASSEFNFIDGIPFVGILSPDAQALSGWIGTVDLRTRYTLSEDASARTALGLRLWGRAVTLSEESRDFLDANTDPGDDPIEAADFSSAVIELTLNHDRALGNGTLRLGAAAGITWAGGDRNYDYLRLTAERGIAVSDTDRLSFSAFAEERFHAGSGGQQDWRYGLGTGWTHAFASGAAVTASLNWRITESDNLNAVSESWGVQVGYSPAQPVGPAELVGILGAQWTDYPDYVVGFFPVPGGRQDTRTFARIEATFNDWSYAGFAPVVTLDAERTDSNVSRFETEGLSLGVGLRSTF